LLGVILIEQDDQWAVVKRRYFSAEPLKLPDTPSLPTTAQTIVTFGRDERSGHARA
jgi:hypothetical protein